MDHYLKWFVGFVKFQILLDQKLWTPENDGTKMLPLEKWNNNWFANET